MTEAFNRFDEDSHRLDADAFAACYQQFSGGVRAALRARLRSEADVDDCMSRVFEKLWQHGPSVHPAARGAWLMVVARREAAMSWRTQKRVDAALEGLQTQFEEMSDGDQSPVEGMLKAETIEKLKQAASELPADQREVLRRRFSDGLSFREIAQELDIPLGTALTRLHTALKRLRKLLNES